MVIKNTKGLKELADEQYQVRGGHISYNNTLNKVLFSYISIQILKTLVNLSTWYLIFYHVRVVLAVTIISLQCIGLLEPTLGYAIKAFQNMEHHVRTQYGTSDEFMKSLISNITL